MNEMIFNHAVTLTAGFIAASEKSPPTPAKVERVLIANYRLLLSAQESLLDLDTSLELPAKSKVSWNASGQVPKAAV